LEFADIGIWLLFIVSIIITFIWRFKDRQTQLSGEEPEVPELPDEKELEEEEEPPELPDEKELEEEEEPPELPVEEGPEEEGEEEEPPELPDEEDPKNLDVKE